MQLLSIRLGPKLVDLFQHCQTLCNADCCGWDAFDFSEHWLSQWCDFRDADTIGKARLDIERVRNFVADCDLLAEIEVKPYHRPKIKTLLMHLDNIDSALAGNKRS